MSAHSLDQAGEQPAPGPWRASTRALMRLGVWGSTALLTALACVLAAGLALAAASGGVVAAVTIACALVVAPLTALLLHLAFELERARARIDLMRTHDELTGVANRRHFMAVAQREWESARRYGTDGALLLVDADHFRHINEGHGHLCGDELLRCIAVAVAGLLRQPDLIARFFGEELIVFLPHTDPLGALDVAERIRQRVQALRLSWQGVEVGTTVSIGVAPWRSDLPSFDWMIHEADTALRAAKADGRNCVRTPPHQPRRSGEAYPVNSR